MTDRYSVGEVLGSNPGAPLRGLQDLGFLESPRHSSWSAGGWATAQRATAGRIGIARGTRVLLGPRTMERLDDAFAGAEIKLSDRYDRT
ncbi:MAG TPA: hypothetical protein VME22_17720 [Solirubrobacteraceae bacterium]|nr:hypothetical protein [Solirubrobacteraceae bacterium]